MEEDFEESSHAVIYNGGVNQRKMLLFLGLFKRFLIKVLLRKVQCVRDSFIIRVLGFTGERNFIYNLYNN